MNRFMKGALYAAPLLVAAMSIQGCATKIKASASTNPPPAEAFAAYSRIEVRPVVFRNGAGNAAAMLKIDQNIKHDLAASLAEWNKKPNNNRTLIIEPVVEEMNFKSGAKRIFLGPLAGSSGVLLRLNIHDGKGRQVASPEFFQRADAMAAGWTFGVHDNMMLTRVANLSTNYVKNNYAQAVGGPTGSDDAVLAPK
jgi:hypothetical protein